MVRGLFELRRYNRLSSFHFVWYASASTTSTEVPTTGRELPTQTTTTTASHAPPAGTLQHWFRGRGAKGNFREFLTVAKCFCGKVPI